VSPVGLSCHCHSICLASQDQSQHIRTTQFLWLITPLRQDNIRQLQGHIPIVPTLTLTPRRQVHTPTQLEHIQELLLRDTVPHGLIPIVIISIKLPPHYQSPLLLNQLPLRELRLFPRPHNGLLSQLIIPHTPVTAPGLAWQLARLPAHTKNSPTSKDCLRKNVRSIPSSRVWPLTQPFVPVRNLMFGFGDDRNPSNDTLNVMEEILVEYIADIVGILRTFYSLQ
jgi:hypothetical protein